MNGWTGLVLLVLLAGCQAQAQIATGSDIPVVRENREGMFVIAPSPPPEPPPYRPVVPAESYQPASEPEIISDTPAPEGGEGGGGGEGEGGYPPEERLF